MATSVPDMMSRLASQIEHLSERYEAVRRENRDLAGACAGLREENARLVRELDALKLDNEYLAVSHKLAGSPDELVRTRRLIARLIRDIDKSISLLKE